MSFDAVPSCPQRIAVIGGGISGLAAAYRLAPHHNVTLYEAADRFGGHARTIIAGKHGDQPVDTGFIVFNYVNYPHLTRMFSDLGVAVERSDMSFGATIDNGAVEYGLANLGALIGQKRNLLRPGFARMVRDILRFNARAESVAACPEMTVGELMSGLDLGSWFRRYYLLPISGAIWSTPPEEINAFPASSLVQFFRNHALLSATGQHQWWTVSGGSRNYVDKLTAHLEQAGVSLRAGTPVKSVARDGFEVTVKTEKDAPAVYDQVVFACHSDDALRLLSDPSDAEGEALSALRYQDNRMILHCDPNQMPRRRACWSSWVYKASHDRPQSAIGVTYWMNRLQNIPAEDPLFVSLNPIDEVPEEFVYDETTFRHPVFDREAIRAQGQLQSIQGENKTWFAGAYTRHGFHEDGFASAVRVARLMERQFA